MNKKVVVIGAGLTGLTTAFYLKKKGIDFVLLEKAEQVGGVIQTGSKKGFVFEQGPSSGTLNNPEVIELFEDLDFTDQIEIALPASKSRLIWYKNHWEALPSGFLNAIKTPLFTFKDKIRILGEPFRKKGDNPNETLSELVLRRMGQSYLDYAVDPFLGGIYAGDPSCIVTKYALPKLYNLEQNYGSFIKGAFKKAKEPKNEREKKVTKAIFSVKGGFFNLIEKLTEAIGNENIVLNSENIQVEKGENNYIVITDIDKKEQKIEADFVVSAIPAPNLKEMFHFLDEKQFHKITSVRYAPVVQVSVAFDDWKGMPIHSFGGLIPSKEQKPLLGILFPSAIFCDRANENGVLLSVFIGGIRQQEIIKKTDEQIKEILEEQLSEMLQISDYNPTFIKIFRYQHAIPQYEVETEQRLKAIQNIEQKHKGFFLAGNLRDGIGISDRIRQGVSLAENINRQFHDS